MLALDANQWLKGFQRLDRSLEADRSGVDAVFGCGLGHYRLWLMKQTQNAPTEEVDFTDAGQCIQPNAGVVSDLRKQSPA